MGTDRRGGGMTPACRVSPFAGGHCGGCQRPLPCGGPTHVTRRTEEGRHGEIVITPLVWCGACCPVHGERKEKT